MLSFLFSLKHLVFEHKIDNKEKRKKHKIDNKAQN